MSRWSCCILLLQLLCNVAAWVPQSGCHKHEATCQTRSKATCSLLSSTRSKRSLLESSFTAPPSSSSSSAEPLYVSAQVQEICRAYAPIYLFDGVCNFCSASVHYCYDHDRNAVLRYAPLQSPTGRLLLEHFGKDPDDTSNLVLVVDAQNAYFASDAVLEIGQRLEGPWRPAIASMARLLLPLWVRNALYKFISQNRDAFFQKEVECRVDLDPARFIDSVEEDGVE